MNRIIIYILSFTVLIACNRKSNDSVNENSFNHENSLEIKDYSLDDYTYKDGTYCASIDYYNPNTGHSNTYTLKVEVENDELTVIYWPNGGWLDSSHFSPEDISDGSCFIVSDIGAEYSIQIIGKNCISDNYIDDEDDYDSEEEYSLEEDESEDDF